MNDHAIDVIVRMRKELLDEEGALREQISDLSPQTETARDFKAHLVTRRAAIHWVIHRLDIALNDNEVVIYELSV